MREEMNFNTEWLFTPHDCENGEDFVKVCIPHSNKILETHKGEDFQEQIDSYRFISWYKKYFRLDNSYEDKNIFIEFEGVATIASVYVNGEFVGTHKGAYTGFIYDITSFVKTDGSENILAVQVDSTKQSEVPPEGGDVDYCLFGGIVRNVNMIVTEKIYIDDVFITTPNIKLGDGTVHIEAIVKNESEEDKQIILEADIKDKKGETVATLISKQIVKSGDTVMYSENTSKVDDVKFWNIDEPNLYTAELKIKYDDVYTDMIATSFGFRWFEFTSNIINKINNDESAFYLNGKKTVIRGINRHEQWPWIGRAANDKLQRADADMVKNLGMNLVRCSHYPQSKAFLDRCDEIGLMVFEEAPGWQHVGNEEWKSVFIENIKEMIKRDKNHPSIISWGTRANESFDSHDLYEKTNELAHTMDATRPTHGVRRMESYNDSEFQEDIFCVNYTYPEIPRETPFIITEHTMDWFNGNGLPGTTDKQAVEFIKNFAEPMNYYYGNKYCAGGVAWSMFDYNNEVNYTKTGNVFYSGMYDLFRYEKPVANLYKSQKDTSEEVVLYIANYWTQDSPNEVMVLSNCDEVELFVNGKSKGKIKPNAYENIPHPVYIFKNIDFEVGELKAVGYIDGKQATTSVRHTPKEAVKLVAYVDYDVLKADGSDFTNVTIELVDENGTVLPYDTSKVKISVSGAGRFIGEEEINLEGGHTGFIAQSKYMETGKITCKVTVVGNDSIEDAICEIDVVDLVL